MKLLKSLVVAAVAMMMVSPVMAQEFDDFDDFGDSSSESKAGGFSIGGEAKISPRLYIADMDGDTLADKTVFVDPQLKLKLGYEAANVEFLGTLALNKAIVTDYKEDILNELIARVYIGDFVLEGGKEKVVWGKGDKLHVLDNFNANDLTDFIIPDYIDRRIAEPMIRVAYNSPSSNNLRIEGIWAPMMTPDRLGKGRWTPDAVTSLQASLTSAGTALAQGLISTDPTNPVAVTKILANASSLSNDLYPDTNSLKYSQFGIRCTGTVGSWDLGGSYYYGHYKTPTVDSSKVENYIMKYLQTGSVSESDKFIKYDPLNVLGLEAAGVVGPVNTRFELGLNLSGDAAGDDPAVKNNSLNWVAGFDIDLPLHNMNLNAQTIGKVILNKDNIKAGDAEYDKDDIYSNNKLVFNLSDSFYYDKIKPELVVLYGIERSDFAIQPKVTYSIKPGFELSAQGLILFNADDKEKSEFKSWVKQNNSFIQLGMKYSF